jgi:hypothetical protein
MDNPFWQCSTTTPTQPQPQPQNHNHNHNQATTTSTSPPQLIQQPQLLPALIQQPQLLPADLLISASFTIFSQISKSKKKKKVQTSKCFGQFSSFCFCSRESLIVYLWGLFTQPYVRGL